MMGERMEVTAIYSEAELSHFLFYFKVQQLCSSVCSRSPILHLLEVIRLHCGLFFEPIQYLTLISYYQYQINNNAPSQLFQCSIKCDMVSIHHVNSQLIVLLLFEPEPLCKLDQSSVTSSAARRDWTCSAVQGPGSW